MTPDLHSVYAKIKQLLDLPAAALMTYNQDGAFIASVKDAVGSETITRITPEGDRYLTVNCSPISRIENPYDANDLRPVCHNKDNVLVGSVDPSKLAKARELIAAYSKAD